MTKAMDTTIPESFTIRSYRPFDDEQSALRQIRAIVSDRNFLHGEYAVSPLEWDQLYTTDDVRDDIRSYAYDTMARNMGYLILEEKKEAFRERFDFDRGQIFRADAVVFSPQEWREFEDKLVSLLTQTRVLRDD